MAHVSHTFLLTAVLVGVGYVYINITISCFEIFSVSINVHQSQLTKLFFVSARADELCNCHIV